MKRVKEIRPKFHVFGHIHEARGVKKVKLDDQHECTFINAASVGL